MKKIRINLTIDQEVYIKVLDFVQKGELSGIVNDFLYNLIDSDDSDVFKEKKNLLDQKESLSSELNKVLTKLSYIENKEKKLFDEQKSKQKQIYESLKHSGGLRDV